MSLHPLASIAVDTGAAQSAAARDQLVRDVGVALSGSLNLR